MLDLQKLTAGGFLEIDHSFVEGDVGLWKIVKKTDYDTQSDTLQSVIEIDKNTHVAGDEVFLEYNTDEGETEAYLFRTFDKFARDTADSWPPPLGIEIDDVEYGTIDPDADEDKHEGFKTRRIGDGEIRTTWEYESEDGSKLLQVSLEEGIVEMRTGYRLATMFIKQA